MKAARESGGGGPDTTPPDIRHNLLCDSHLDAPSRWRILPGDGPDRTPFWISPPPDGTPVTARRTPRRTPPDRHPVREGSHGRGGTWSRETAVASALRVLLKYDRLTDAVPHLHALVAKGVDTTRSAVLQTPLEGTGWPLLSAHGLKSAASVWRPRGRERKAVETFLGRARPHYETSLATRYPTLARHLDVTRALLVPLVQTSTQLGLLAIGLSRRPPAARIAEVALFARSLSLALARARLNRRVETHRQVDEMLRAFSEAVSASLDLTAGLDALCRSAQEIFGAARTSVWLHERRQRQLILAASSDPVSEAAHRIATSDLSVPAARGLRGAEAQLEPIPAAGDAASSASLVLVPLRGRRRALGTIVLEGVGPDGWSAQDVALAARELGRDLSGAVENVQLLQDVIHSRRELENTFNSIPDLVAVCDRQLRLAHVNRAFAERVGMVRESLIDLPIIDLVGSDLSGWLTQVDLNAAQPAAPATCEVEDALLGGTFAVTLTRLLDQSGDPRGLVMVARDITERARLEVERAALRQRLAQSEKLAALGQFVAGIAHELNNPLQGVLGHIELIAATNALSPALKKDFRTVSREAERAAKIVRNLLVFTGSQKLLRRRFSLNAVVGRVLALRSDALREGHVKVTRSYEANLPRLSGDPMLVQQALINILMNAEQAVAAASPRRIDVTTEFDETRGVASVKVRDSGPGLADDVLTRIFEPFYTTKEVGQGTGLGLTITYGIIQEHRGAITASNAPGGGAVFTVELPVSQRVTRRAAIR